MELYCLRKPNMDEAAMEKEFRKDYWIKVGNDFYETTFFTYGRFEAEYSILKNDGYFVPDTNSIALPSVDENTIITALRKMGDETVKALKPCKRMGNTLFLNLSEGEKRLYSENGWSISHEIDELSFVCHING